MASVKPPKYPGHLYTIEWHLGSHSGSLPVLHHSYPDELIARAILNAAAANMNRSNGSITKLRLWHKHQLLSTISPPAAPVARPLPEPVNGVRHIPATSRKLTRGPQEPLTSRNSFYLDRHPTDIEI